MANTKYIAKPCSVCNEIHWQTVRRNANTLCKKCKTKIATRRAKTWALANPEKRRTIVNNWRKRNPDAICSIAKRARNKIDPAKKKEYQKTYLERHPDRRKQSQRKYRDLRPESVKKSNRKWRGKNPEKCKTHVRNRRARLAKVFGSHIATDISAIRKLQNDRCAICRESLRGKGDVDHIIPIAKGGSNDRRNLQLAHRKCNGSKGAKDPIIFMQELGYLL